MGGVQGWTRGGMFPTDKHVIQDVKLCKSCTMIRNTSSRVKHSPQVQHPPATRLVMLAATLLLLMSTSTWMEQTPVLVAWHAGFQADRGRAQACQALPPQQRLLSRWATRLATQHTAMSKLRVFHLSADPQAVEPA